MNRNKKDSTSAADSGTESSQPIVGVEHNASTAGPHTNGAKPNVMLDRWLREPFEDAPYHIIAGVGPGMVYSHELVGLADRVSSSLGYINCETDGEELISGDHSMSEKQHQETSKKI
jgi:hypothetical protein